MGVKFAHWEIKEVGISAQYKEVSTEVSKMVTGNSSWPGKEEAFW